MNGWDKMQNAVCFDIGGTFIKYGIVSESGDVLYKSKFPTPKSNCRVNVPFKLCRVINELKTDYSFDRIGISTAGQVDSDEGKIIFASDNLPDYTGLELSKVLKQSTGLDCYVENDVNAAALGELWKSKTNKTFLFLTLGTGIGGALIINGKLFKGAGGSAGEAGHIVIIENGKDCTCGGKGCYEKYASVTAFVKNYCAKAGCDENSINGEILMQKVSMNDTIAVEAYNEFLDHIVTGLVSVVTFMDPGLVLIGGGISAQGNGFIDQINSRFLKRVMPSYAKYTKICAASLMNDSGLIGACYAAYNRDYHI